MKRRSFLRVIGAVASATVLPLPSFGGGTPTTEVVKATPKVVAASSADLFVPEMWARESLGILEQNMVVSKLVTREFHDNPGEALDKVRIARNT